MTTPIGTLGIHGSPSGARDVRDKGAADAPGPRTRSADGSEFAAMLLLAGALGASTRSASDAARKRSVAEPDQSGGKARGHVGAKAPGGATATSIAGRTLAQSQADELRTVGKGVNLKALAQAEMRGESAGGAAGAAPNAKGNADASRVESKGSGDTPAKAGAERVELPRAAVQPSGDQVDPAKATSAARVAATVTPGAGAVMASLDRLSRASSRAVSEPSRGVSGVGSTPTLTARAVGALTKAGLEAARSSGGSVVTGGGAAGQSSGHSNGQASGIADAAGTGGSAAAAKAGPALADGRSPAGVASEASPPKFAAQVHRALGHALTSREGTVTIHLTPEHLGRLRVEVSRGEGGVRATFEAESSEARGLLQRALPELKSAMESRGLHVETLDVRQGRGQEPSDAERPGGDGGSGSGGGGDVPSDAEPRSQDRDPGPRGDGDDAHGGGRRRHGGRGAPEVSGMEPAAFVSGPNHPAEPGERPSTIEVVA